MKPGNNTGQIIINFLIKLDIPALLFLKRIRIIIETKGRIINHLYWFCIYQEFMAHWRIILFVWTIPRSYFVLWEKLWQGILCCHN